MLRPAVRALVALAVAVPAFALASRGTSPAAEPAAVPSPRLDVPRVASAKTATAVFAGGCFWGVEAVFEHVRGVTNVVSGYAGGTAKTAVYEVVSAGQTEHAEAVKVTYDPSQVTYGELLRVFFSIAHDPTQVNRQGPDVGPQYRSAIFFADEEQQRVAAAYIAQVTEARTFSRPIATQLVPLKAFYDAEAYHQDFADRNPTYPYIVIHDRPKVEALKKHLPEMYRERAKS